MRVPVRVVRTPLVPLGFAAWVPARRQVWIASRTVLTRRLLAHELAHVTQAETSAWPLAYVLQWAHTGFSYRRMPFEREARAAETNPAYLSWADDLLGGRA